VGKNKDCRKSKITIYRKES